MHSLQLEDDDEIFFVDAWFDKPAPRRHPRVRKVPRPRPQIPVAIR